MTDYEKLIRNTYCEGFLDGKESSTKHWKVSDIRNGKETPIELSTLLKEIRDKSI